MGERFNVFMQVPAVVAGKRPWSLVAQAVTGEQAEVYRSTLLFPVHVEAAVEAASRKPSPSG